MSAMERAGNEDMSDDVERKGLGTPATRADIIEKLVKDGFVKREKKQIIPTEDGMKLITVLPDVVKSPKLTADWENALTLVAKGEMEREDFMADIETMVSDLIHTYHEVSDEQKKMFAQEQKVLGKCPNCGGAITFDSGLQKMKCPYCDTEFEMETLAGYDSELKKEQPDDMK